MNIRTKELKRNKLFVLGFVACICVVTYIVVSSLLERSWSDFSGHVVGVDIIFETGLVSLLEQNSYPLWQLTVVPVKALLGCDSVFAAPIATGLLNAILYILIYLFLKRENEDINKAIPVLTFLLMLMGPMYAPWYNENVYLGQGTPNVWHNPTTICVRVPAMLTFMIILHILKEFEEKGESKRKYYMLLSVLMIICNLAKPSFIQIIVPGLGLYLIYLLIKTKSKAFTFCVKVAFSFVPSVLLLAWQYGVSFITSSAADGGIEIAWFDVLKSSSPNILISMILGYFFPLYVIATNISVLKSRDVKLTFFVWLSAFLEVAMLAETGSRRYHGNFGWGHLLSMFFVYVVTFKHFIARTKDYKNNSGIGKATIIIGWLIFLLQVLVGIYYIYGIVKLGWVY